MVRRRCLYAKRIRTDSSIERSNNEQLIDHKVVQTKSGENNQRLRDPLIENTSPKPVKCQVNPRQTIIKPPSLTNIGANCCLNAAIQGISSCNKFVKDIVSLHQRPDLHCNPNLEKLLIFQQLINILSGRSIDRLEISRNSIFRHWNKTGQQDSFELLAYVINQVYNDIRSNLEKEKVISRNIQEWLQVPLPMRILIEYSIKCECGQFCEAPLQSDLALHVPMASRKDQELQTLVDEFFDNDKIEGYDCENKYCSGMDARRHTKLRLPLPRTICIHLQRTFWNGHQMVKINNKIKFEKTLKIKSEFCTKKNTNKSFNVVKVSSSEETFCSNNENNIRMRCDANSNQDPLTLNNSNMIANSDQSTNVPVSNGSRKDVSESTADIKRENMNDNHERQLDDDDIPITDKKYTLCSVIVHCGSVHGGHYVCYKLVDGHWFLTDDSQIQQVNESEVLGCQAYILFYEEVE